MRALLGLASFLWLELWMSAFAALAHGGSDQVYSS